MNKSVSVPLLSSFRNELLLAMHHVWPGDFFLHGTGSLAGSKKNGNAYIQRKDLGSNFSPAYCGKAG